jgi:glycosyltransferase involved in cell wall biosynthesis
LVSSAIAILSAAHWQNRRLPMRILLLHNRYRAEGGEERAVADIQALLSDRGHEAAVLERSSASADRTRAAYSLVHGGVDSEEVAAAVRRIGAEVVHAHNVHPLFGWRALRAAREAGARTVLHLHNFRLFCAIYSGYRDGHNCFRCTGRNTLPGVRLQCRGSLPEALAYGAGLARQQPHLLEHADVLVTVSDATRRRLEQLGVPPGRIEVLPNFVPANRFAANSRAGEGRYAFASGRLVEEKGFDTAIAAARAAGVPLLIAGDGPDSQRLRRLAAAGAAGPGPGVTFAGRLSEQAVAEARAHAAVTLVPSRWEEPCPYSVLDSLAAGVPALVSDRGGLPELVAADEALDPGNADAWATELARLWDDPALRAHRGEVVLARARERHGEDRYLELLSEVYGPR